MRRGFVKSQTAPGASCPLPEHFAAKWIRFAIEECGTTRSRADSIQVETALVCSRRRFSTGYGGTTRRSGRARRRRVLDFIAEHERPRMLSVLIDGEPRR